MPSSAKSQSFILAPSFSKIRRQPTGHITKSPPLMAFLADCFVKEDEKRPKVAYNEEFSAEIPVVSLTRLLRADQTNLEDIEKVKRGCAEWGAFQLLDHGVPLNLMKDMETLSRKFFTESNIEEKLTFHFEDTLKRGGYEVGSSIWPGKEDFREYFTFITHSSASSHYQVDKSRWPRCPEAWKESVESYSRETMRVTKQILGILSVALGLEDNEMLRACGGDIAFQKVLANFYPPCPLPELALGFDRHSDPTAITLLMQDKVGGLQVTRDNGSTWVTVRPLSGAILVIMGTFMHLVTNGQLKKMDHRVVVNSMESRVSVVAFHYPCQEASVRPLAKFRGGKNEEEDSGVNTYAEWYASLMVNRQNKQANNAQMLLQAFAKSKEHSSTPL